MFMSFLHRFAKFGMINVTMELIFFLHFEKYEKFLILRDIGKKVHCGFVYTSPRVPSPTSRHFENRALGTRLLVGPDVQGVNVCTRTVNGQKGVKYGSL